MKPPRILIVVAAILLSLVLVQGAQAETYIWAGGWGTLGTGNYEFTSPEGIAVNGSEVYVADSGNSRILKFTMDGSYLTQWGSNGTGDGQFTTPHSIAADSNGNVYVADPIPARIQKFNSGGTYLTQWGYPTYNYMQWPAGVAVNSTGYVFDAEGYDSPQIVVFTSTGTRVDGWTTPSGGSGYPTTHTRPRGVAVGSSGNVYVVSYSNNLIQKFTPDGTYTTYWGGTQGSGNGEFNSPQGIAVDSNENVYVADTGNNRIQKFTPDGLYLTQWGTAGTGDGQFNSPQGVAVDNNGNVYVADTGNNRIQKFSSLDVTGCRRIDTPGSYVLKNDILNSNIAKCIEILSSDVTFDGNNFTIDGTDTGSSYGIYAHHTSKTLQNVNIRNVTLTDWNYGLEFYNVNSSSIENTTSNYQTQGFYIIGHYLNLAKNNASFNTVGCSLDGNYNNLNHNIFIGNENYGIQTSNSHNIITYNTLSNTSYQGILLANGARNNTVANNSIINSGWGGIYLFNTGTENNTIVSNSIFNCQYPLYIDRASNNTIFNNYFNNTFDGVYFYSPIYTNFWNTTKTAGTNIIGGSYVAGNYWGNTSGTGYSQTCTDAGDGICHAPYTIASGNIDNLPLTNNAAPAIPAPVANFTATSPSGPAPLPVSFTDLSLNSPYGWAWFFGDEKYTQAWTEQTASAGWSARAYHSSVAMPDGSIVLMGGTDTGIIYYNETWRSADNGSTWELVNGSSGWSARWSLTSVAMPDGSIVLMGVKTKSAPII